MAGTTHPSANATNREIRLFRPFAESPLFHFYALQFLGFSYLLYRFLSRSYEVYGSMPPRLFDYPRQFVTELWPVPALHYSSFQFIYSFLTRPGPETIYWLQVVICASCLLGLLGVVPKYAALVSFLLGTHLTGFVQATNGDFDGGSLVLCLMAILALSPSKSFYGVRNGFSLSHRSVDAQWPVFLFFLVTGAFYTCSGLNKVFDVGLDWPFRLRLDKLATSAIESSVFLSSRYSIPEIASLHHSSTVSAVGGIVSFVGEIGFITILFLPRFRLLFVASMVIMHVLVYALAGINFLGNSVILLLCLDWNSLVRRIDVYYDPASEFIGKKLKTMKHFDWFDRLRILPEGTPANQGLVEAWDENGERYFGVDALEQAATRCPALAPLGLPLKIPGAIQVARLLWRRMSTPSATSEVSP